MDGWTDGERVKRPISLTRSISTDAQ